MLSSDLKSKISSLWDKFWSGGIANPLTAIEQMSYLIFMKRLEDLENDRIILAKRATQQYSSVFEGKDEMRWSVWQNYEGEKMLKHVRDEVFPFIKNLRGEGSYFTRQMKDANFIIPKASLLQEAVQIIDSMHISEQNEDVQGDLYEHLLSELKTAGKNGQFRTPRHIIRMMVEILDPKKGQRICDPACGTGGFLVNAYQHIVKENTSDDIIKIDEEGLPYNLRGDKLSEKEREFMRKNQFYGFDFDSTMVTIGSMNMILHGFEEPNIEYADTLSKSFVPQAVYDVIFANPPFSGSINKSEINDNFQVITPKTELLFLELFYNLLKNGGQAAVIVPEGAMSGTTNAHKKIKQMILENCRVDAVISLPSGVFKPYAGAATSVILFTKGEKTEQVWFYMMENDGFTLDDRRLKIGKNDIPDIISKIITKEKSPKSWTATLDEIKENRWNLSATRYQPDDVNETVIQDPTEILENIFNLENEILKDLKELSAVIRSNRN